MSEIKEINNTVSGVSGVSVSEKTRSDTVTFETKVAKTAHT